MPNSFLLESCLKDSVDLVLAAHRGEVTMATSQIIGAIRAANGAASGFRDDDLLELVVIQAASLGIPLLLDSGIAKST